MTRIPQAPTKQTAVQPSLPAYRTFQAREKELKDQLREVQERRDELSNNTEGKSGGDLSGIQSRIGVLDKRILQIENDLQTVGEQLAASAPGSIAEPPTRTIYRGFDDGDMFGAAFGGAFGMLVLFMPFVIRNWLRRRRGGAKPAAVTGGVAPEKIDRMEQAIDAIAIEIERVSEN